LEIDEKLFGKTNNLIWSYCVSRVTCDPVAIKVGEAKTKKNRQIRKEKKLHESQYRFMRHDDLESRQFEPNGSIVS
jgi:hypothetical protein